MTASVVILSTRSLFALGVVKRLQQYLDKVQLTTIDPRQQDAMNQIIAAHPQALILDMTDPVAVKFCSLSTLFGALPAVKIIRLDPFQKQMQVVSSVQHPAHAVQDIASVITAAEK